MANLIVLVVLVSLFYDYGIKKRYLFSILPAPYSKWADKIVRKIQDAPYLIYSFKKPDLPVYDLIIDEKDWKKINDSLPTEEGAMFVEENQKYINAKFSYGGKSYNVEVRYRGNSDFHWRYDKKSWRIRFSDSAIFEGTSAINLIVGGDLLEPFNNYRAEKIGLKVLDSDFVLLRINGKAYGVYYKINQWSKEFLETNKLSGDTDFFTERYINEKYIFEDPYYWDKRVADPGERPDNYVAIARLTYLVNQADQEEFHDNIFNIVDKKSFMEWYLHTLLIGGNHEDWRHNMNLYYDNTNGKFKFFTWQSEGNDLASIGSPYLFFNPLITRVLESPDFATEINQRAWDYVSDKDNLKDDLKFIDDLYNSVRIEFFKDSKKNFSNSTFIKGYKETRSLIESNFNFIKEYLKKSEAFTKVIYNKNSFLNYEIAEADITVNSAVDMTIKEIKISGLVPGFLVSAYYDSDMDGKLTSADILLEKDTVNKDGEAKFGEQKIVLSSKLVPPADKYDDEYVRTGFILQPVTHKIFFTAGIGTGFYSDDFAVDMELDNSLTGKKVGSEVIYIDNSNFNNLDDINLSLNEFISKNPSFKATGNGDAYVSAGTYYINKTLIVPKGIHLKIEPGAIFYMAKGVSIGSYSPVIAKGSKDYPIKFLSANSNDYWGNFGIVDVPEKSEFEYVEFEYGGDTRVNGIHFSGALASHSSDISIKNCQFKYAGGDDGLNVKNAKVEIVDSYFYKNGFDGLDGDFISGKIYDNIFDGNGNDGIDISGSSVEISNNEVKSSGDKCISLGENSNPDIFSNKLNGCVMGIAVKDLSEPKIYDNIISGNQTGISVYQKKEFFGGGFPKLGKNTFENNGQDIATDVLSKITNL